MCRADVESSHLQPARYPQPESLADSMLSEAAVHLDSKVQVMLLHIPCICLSV